MPAAPVVNMGVATRTLVTEKLNGVVKPKSIFIDNVNAAADASLVFNDVFTPSITSAVAGPILTTVPRLQINVAKGECISTEDFIKSGKFIGTVNVVRGVLDANCFVSFIYDLE